MKVFKWYLKRFVLVIVSCIAIIISIVGLPVVISRCFLSLSITTSYATVDGIVQGTKLNQDKTDYAYTVSVLYYIDDTEYHSLFTIKSDNYIEVGNTFMIEYYSKFPNIIKLIDGDNVYYSNHINSIVVYFWISIFVGVPTLCYTSWFFKKKKKPRVNKKAKTSTG